MKPLAAVPRLAVLASGTGTLLEAIMRADLPLVLVAADRSCRALDLAAAANLPGLLVDRRQFGYRPRTAWDRAGFTAAFARQLQEQRIDLVAMAGFMTIFDSSIFNAFPERVLNSHPALLPHFKGERAVADALAAGVTETGTTIHVATPELDSGRILAQERVPVQPGDSVDSLWERIKVTERVLYPAAIRRYLAELATA